MISIHKTSRFASSCFLLVVFSGIALQTSAHEHTRAHFLATARRVALAQAKQLAESSVDKSSDRKTAQLSINIFDGTGQRPLAGLVRITNLTSGKAIELDQAIHRAMNWYSVLPQSTHEVPQTKLRIETLRGIQSDLVEKEIDLTGKSKASVQVKLPLFYAPRQHGLVSGNTHLHLMKLSYKEAIRYLKTVPQSDGLDLVFLSHLRRIPDERTYISNLIVENDFINKESGEMGELANLSNKDVLFGNGEEHRHNFDIGGQGFGHVMLLNLKKLITPVSIGPGIMHEGTDGRTLQKGILEARADSATVVWCHGHWGMEGVPNWVKGLVHAQNMFDGGGATTYEESFYNYLNLGMKVPFSTGTDWFIYDFSRVYVPIQGTLTTKKWLNQLSAGRSYITNGPFLEFEVGEHHIGDTISLAAEKNLLANGRAVSRIDFGSLQLISNGEVVHSVPSKKVGNHFEADLEYGIKLQEPGWIALRVPRKVTKNELDKELFAHTSPIYVELAGQRIFRPQIARQLIKEIESSIAKISTLGVFDAGEEQAVHEVYHRAIATLQQRLEEELQKSIK